MQSPPDFCFKYCSFIGSFASFTNHTHTANTLQSNAWSILLVKHTTYNLKSLKPFFYDKNFNILDFISNHQKQPTHNFYALSKLPNALHSHVTHLIL